MTSKRQRAANRANSAKSTGPRSKAGKSAAKLNARLHGLATAAASEPGAEAEIQRLAHAIVDEARRPNLFELARRVAEAELDLRRIRRARVILAKLSLEISKSFPSADSPPKKAGRDKNRPKPSSLSELALQTPERTLGRRAPVLVEAPQAPAAKRNLKPDVLERYERRATSRRKSAIRRFDAVSRSETPPSASGGA